MRCDQRHRGVCDVTGWINQFWTWLCDVSIIEEIRLVAKFWTATRKYSYFFSFLRVANKFKLRSNSVRLRTGHFCFTEKLKNWLEVIPKPVYPQASLLRFGLFGDTRMAGIETSVYLFAMEGRVVAGQRHTICLQINITEKFLSFLSKTWPTINLILGKVFCLWIQNFIFCLHFLSWRGWGEQSERIGEESGEKSVVEWQACCRVQQEIGDLESM
jgi:hypothetical protein